MGQQRTDEQQRALTELGGPDIANETRDRNMSRHVGAIRRDLFSQATDERDQAVRQELEAQERLIEEVQAKRQARIAAQAQRRRLAFKEEQRARDEVEEARKQLLAAEEERKRRERKEAEGARREKIGGGRGAEERRKKKRRCLSRGGERGRSNALYV